MEKDFKKEYSKHIKSETPDLWSRIESGITEKTPSVNGKKRATIYRWKKMVPAAAAVLLLLVAAPIFAPRVMEKSSDMAMFDAKAETENAGFSGLVYGQNEACDEGGIVMEEAVEEESIPETLMTNTEADTESKIEMPVENAGGTTVNTTTSNTTSGMDEYTSKKENQQISTEKDKTDNDEIKTIEIKLIHFQVKEQTQDMNLLAIDKDHIDMVCDLYLITVDGQEKVLAVPPMEEEVALEPGMWYDLTVTDSTEYGIDYIWVE